ncbi:MAG TPA: DUF4112 domain-containing protein [Longimicrobium sp.]|nr:DUF4112 domain-containing protein [Longimicrobium sp.]
MEIGAVDAGAFRRVERLAYLLDDSIPVPGTGRRFGVDAVIGLVPGFGDAAGALLSAYIVLEAARLGTPFAVLLRMVLNVAVESVVGAVPLLGDLFDAGWKANARNVRLLRRAVDRPESARRSSTAVLLGIALVLAAVLAGVAVLVYLVLRSLAGALG